MAAEVHDTLHEGSETLPQLQQHPSSPPQRMTRMPPVNRT